MALKDVVIRFAPEPVNFGGETAFKVTVTASRVSGQAYLVTKPDGTLSLEFDNPGGYDPRGIYRHLHFYINNVPYVKGNCSLVNGQARGWLSRGWDQPSASVAALGTWNEIGQATFDQWNALGPRQDVIRRNDLKIAYEQALADSESRETLSREAAAKAEQLAQVALDARRAAADAKARWKLDTSYEDFRALPADEQAFVLEHLDDLGSTWKDPADLLSSAKDAVAAPVRKVPSRRPSGITH